MWITAKCYIQASIPQLTQEGKTMTLNTILWNGQVSLNNTGGIHANYSEKIKLKCYECHKQTGYRLPYYPS